MAYVMTLSHFKTFKSLTCKVIGLMGANWSVEATEMGRTARDAFLKEQRKACVCVEANYLRV